MLFLSLSVSLSLSVFLSHTHIHTSHTETDTERASYANVSLTTQVYCKDRMGTGVWDGGNKWKSPVRLREEMEEGWAKGGKGKEERQAYVNGVWIFWGSPNPWRELQIPNPLRELQIPNHEESSKFHRQCLIAGNGGWVWLRVQKVTGIQGHCCAHHYLGWLCFSVVVGG